LTPAGGYAIVAPFEEDFMAGVNKVILVGNLGRDPELRFTQGGTPVLNFTLATNEAWTDRESGQRQERTEWHRIVMFGKQAQTLNEYLAKGRQVYVEGALQTREWTDREGNKRYTTEVKALNLQLLGSRADAAQPTADAAALSEPDPDFKDEDIPF
jgi:single-strand DNA-binding protein